MIAALPKFFGRVESLRGLAAGMVAFGHVLGAFAPFAQHLPAYNVLRTFGKGDSAVLMFFVISGFVLFFSFERYRSGEHPILRFLIARVFRIYPASIATILLIVVITAVTGRSFLGNAVIDPLVVLKNLLLLDTSMNGVMWTLQVELLAAPVIVAAYLAYRRFGVIALWALLAAFTALSFVGSFNRLIGTPTLGLHAFMLGMIVAVAGERWFAGLSRVRATAAFIAAMFMFFACFPLLGWTSHWGTLVATACAGIMIALAAFNNVGPGLASRPARFLGRVSYGFYLLHPLTLLALDRAEVRNVIASLLQSGMSFPVTMVAVFLLSVLAIVPLAYLLLRWVEHPGIAFGQSLFRNRIAPVSAPASPPPPKS